MATEFQTSFIPKQVDPGYGGSRTSSTSLFLLVAVVIFLGSVGAAGFFILRTHLITNEIKKLQTSIDTNLAKYDVPLILEASKLSKRISVTEKLLNDHVAVSELFRMLETTTSLDVSYDSLTFLRDVDNTLRIEASGAATGYPAIVAQSDAYGETSMVADLIFTGLNRNLLNQIEFDLTAKIEPRLISFVDSIAKRNVPVPPPSNTGTTTRTNATVPAMRTSTTSSQTSAPAAVVSPSELQRASSGSQAREAINGGEESTDAIDL
jgi:hypothetical protein